MKIWKWTLLVTDRQVVPLPKGAEVLAVQVQGDAVCLWALCDEAAPAARRLLAMYGTGHPMPEWPGEYLDTFQLSGGGLVFHVFDLGPVAPGTP